MNLKKLFNGVKFAGVTMKVDGAVVKLPLVDVQLKFADADATPVAQIVTSQASAMPSAKVMLTIASYGGQCAAFVQEGLIQT